MKLAMKLNCQFHSCDKEHIGKVLGKAMCTKDYRNREVVVGRYA